MYRLLTVFALVSCAVAGTILVPDDINGRIVGGVDTNIRNHPYMAALQTKSGFHFCSGSIISEDIIVTAAHCVWGFEADELQVRVGSTYYNKGGLLVDVKAYRRHERYNSATDEYDVGVIKLATILRPAKIVPYLKLAERAPSTGTTAVVTGWGVKCFNKCTDNPEILQKVEVDIIDRSTCASNRFNYGKKIKHTMFCASAVGKGTCTGDSGGPLVVGNELVGIVSWSTGCAVEGYPDVYCNVAKVRKWIEKTAQEL